MKKLLKRFLYAYAHGNSEMLGSLLNEDTLLQSNMVGDAKGREIIDKLSMSMEDINATIVTLTNYLEQGSYCIATFHHLHAIDDKGILYPFLYGGKIALQSADGMISKIWMDLEYEYGNTYSMKDHWTLYEGGKLHRTVKNEGLHTFSMSAEEAVYKCFLGLDIMDEDLWKTNLCDDIFIHRAGVDGDSYTLQGKEDAVLFMKKDKEYFDQNQYSLHLHEITEIDETLTHITAWHLSPGKPGNKHIASHMKYAQFYNESIDIDVVKESDCFKIKSIKFTRKENPVIYGYDWIEL